MSGTVEDPTLLSQRSHFSLDPGYFGLNRPYPPVHVLGLSESYGDEIWVMKLGWDEGETPPASTCCVTS